VRAVHCEPERGFTLIEVMISTGIFVFVAVAGFETLRAVGSAATLLQQRAASAAALNTALAQLRSDAASSLAVWTPASTCGTAVSMMKRTAGGTTFITYVVQNGALLRATAAGPMNPCDSQLTLDAVLSGVTSSSAAAIAANTLPAHVDPVSGATDGGIFRSGIPSIAVTSHAHDYDGSSILTGNGIVELTVDVDPAEATVDLVAGNRPNAYTNMLTYTCGDRCEANRLFPEIASLDVDACTADAPDLPDSSSYYVASATTVGANGRIVTTAYAVQLRYGFTFSGASPAVTAYRVGPTEYWPAAANLSDPYPVDYSNNAVRATGAAALAATFGPPANLAAETATCTGIDGEALFHG
jgi:prepilin-type N-terminal cleavage/methylation domain-containing protein